MLEPESRNFRDVCDKISKEKLGVSLVGFVVRWDKGAYHVRGDHPLHGEISHVRGLCPDGYFRFPNGPGPEGTQPAEIFGPNGDGGTGDSVYPPPVQC